MNPQDPLAHLHPLREPVAISWWPVAPGWWLLLLALLLILAGVGYWLAMRYRRNAYRRQALLQLQQLAAELQQHGDGQRYLADLNALLKSVALMAYPRVEVAAASGETWLNFLNGSLSASRQFDPAFVAAAYQPQTPDLDLDLIHRTAALWIKQHKATT